MTRSFEDQVSGLATVAQIIHKTQRGDWQRGDRQPSPPIIVLRLGDVPALTIGGQTEVVYASGGYDVWRSGNLAEPNVDVETAAIRLTEESAT